MNPLWNLVRDHLDVILPVFVPLGFLGVDTLVKWVAGKREFFDLGADVCLAGFSLYSGTVLGLANQGRLTAGADFVTAFLLAALFAFIWWLCVVLSYKRLPVKSIGALEPVLAMVIGSGCTYYCSKLTWELLARL